MNANPVVWFEIYVDDMPRARAFYQALFQVELTEMGNPDPDGSPGMEMWAFPFSMEGPGASGALTKMAGMSPGGSTLVYFGCDDCAVEAARAPAAGGSVMQEKTSLGPHGFMALVRDTEGNVVGLHSMR